jgi:hypothetical protein
MKDFLPNFTFGFLMAQLFPGAVTVVCLTCPYLALMQISSNTVSANLPRMMTLFERVGDVWFSSTRNAVVFLFLSAATGMFVHGVDWMILGWETQKKDAQGKPLCDADGNPEIIGLRELGFHSQTLWKQLLLGPMHMVKEGVRLLRAPKLGWITMEENVPGIDPGFLPIFNWLQDFYLYFGQFYIHMAYSLLTGFFSLAITFVMIGFTPLRLVFVLFIYLLSGTFYVMGRTQLASLFKNEVILVASSKEPKAPLEIVVTSKP